MDKAERQQRPMRWQAAAAVALSLCTLCGCGQKGALYLPDRAPQPVLSPPAMPAVPEALAPQTAPSSESAPAPDTTTRKAPREPDPATAR